jgi:hypothetical protein
MDATGRASHDHQAEFPVLRESALRRNLTDGMDRGSTRESDMVRRLRPVLALAFAMAFLLAGSGETIGAVAFRPDARIQDPYTAKMFGNNIYNATARHQRLKATGFGGGAAQQLGILVSIQNDGARSDRFKVAAPGALAVSGWKIRYIAVNVGRTVCRPCAGTNVTRKVRNGTYVTPTVHPGASLWLMIRLTAPIDGGNIKARTITVHSMARPKLVDAVRWSYSFVGCPC